MKLKIISLTTLTLFLSLMIYKYQDQSLVTHVMESDTIDYQSFKIDEQSKITHYETTDEELYQINPIALKKRSEAEQKNQRVPASQNTKREKEKVQKWKESFVGELLRFQEPDTRVVIKKEKSVTRKIQDSKREYDVVQITFFKKDNQALTSSYNALVDQESGKIVRTWNQTTFEPLRGQRTSFELAPYGSL